MKFGKQLLLRMRSDYEDGYIDYKGLKQRVKACHGGGSGSASYSNSETSSIDTLPSIVSHEGFQSELQHAIGDTEVVDDKSPAAMALKEAFSLELDKVNAFYKAKETDMQVLHARLVQEQSKSVQSGAEWCAKVAQLHDTVELLGDFVTLNQLGFSKILKKCEKKVPQLHMSNFFHERLYTSHFASSVVRVELLTWARLELVRAAPPVRRDPTPAPSLTTIQQPDYPTYNMLDLDLLPIGKISRIWVDMATDGLGQPIKVPVIVAKGERVGPVLGITACLHGNELNGIPLIHRLFREIDCSDLSGTVVAVPVANSPGFVRNQRGYLDNSDLNRCMPGKKDGTAAQIYAHSLMTRVVCKFTYLIDMHTASTGRINSLYVRANMRNPIESRMAMLQNPQIIVHNTGPDGSLRSAAVDIGIPAITIEVGDPQRFHKRFIQFALLGVENIMCSHKMVFRHPQHPDFEPVICTKSHWMFTRSGGVLTVLPEINTWVKEGEVIARIHSIFGDLVEEYMAPSDGIIVGKSVNPVCASGDRILHLGVVTAEFEKNSLDGHESGGKAIASD